MLALALLVVLCLPGVGVQAEEGAKGPTRPAYSPVLRQNEDWSVLAGQDRSGAEDPFDPIKYVPLSDDGSFWVSFGGQARTRVEIWDDFGFGGSNDDTFLATRLRMHADLHAGEHVRFFVEGKSALATERDLPGGNRGLDRDELDLQQAFGDLTLPLGDGLAVTVRGGRQMLLLGKQRLVSPLDWSNSMRAWDGVMAILTCKAWKIHGFWTQFVPVQKYDFNDVNDDEQFYGIYATGPVGATPVALDVYWLARERDAIDDDRHTIGGRVHGKVGTTGLDYDVEGAYQTGERGDLDVSAFMVGSEVGYSIGNCPARPRLWAGFDYASGDRRADDGDLQTFDQLYPLGHAYLGFIDVVGRQNVIDLNTGVTFVPCKKITVRLAGHIFWRAEEHDALYNAGGGVVRMAGTSTDREIGSEIDLLLKYAISRHLVAIGGYSHFFPDEFVSETGADSGIDFTYFILQYTF